MNMWLQLSLQNEDASPQIVKDNLEALDQIDNWM